MASHHLEPSLTLNINKENLIICYFNEVDINCFKTGQCRVRVQTKEMICKMIIQTRNTRRQNPPHSFFVLQHDERPLQQIS